MGSRPRSAATVHSCDPDRSLRATCASRAPDKIGSAPLPIGSFGEVKQAEGIQPPLYYYAAAPVTWFVSGRDKVVALRLFDVFLYLCAAAIIFFAVCDIGGTVLGGGIATLLFASANGLMDVLSYVTNGTIMLTLGAAAIWLSAAGDSRPAADVAAHTRRRRARDHAHHRRAAGRALPARARGRPDTCAGTGGAARRREARDRRGDPAQPVGALESRALPLGRAPGARRQRHRWASARPRPSTSTCTSSRRSSTSRSSRASRTSSTPW